MATTHAAVAGAGHANTVAGRSPTGYILSYGVSYEGSDLYACRQQCAASARRVHDAFVSKCGFAPTFQPKLNADVTASGIVNDVRRVAKGVSTYDVVVVFFSGHGNRRQDAACMVDSAGGVVSVRELQAAHADEVHRCGVQAISFVIILDCCQCRPPGDSEINERDADVTMIPGPECSWFVGLAARPGTPCSTGIGNVTLFTRALLNHIADRVSIEVVFQRVSDEVFRQTKGIQQPVIETRPRRRLVLVDRGAPVPPFVPRQYAVPHHVVAREEMVKLIQAAFRQTICHDGPGTENSVARGAVAGARSRDGAGPSGIISSGAGAGAGGSSGPGGGTADFYVGGGGADRTGTPSAGLRLVAVHGGGGTGKTTAAMAYVAAVGCQDYPRGVLWLCGETWSALELSMQQVYYQHLSASQHNALPRTEACKAVWQWLTQEHCGRWLVVVDNVDQVEDVLPGFLKTLPPSAVGDVLVTTRASSARVVSAVPSAACVEQGCLRTHDAAVAMWRLVSVYNAQHGSHCGLGSGRIPGNSTAADSAEADSGAAGSTAGQELCEVPPDVPPELQQLWLEARGEYTALLQVAKDSECGFCGLPLALVVGTDALCHGGESFSSFLAACEEGGLDHVIRASDIAVVATAPPSATQLLQKHGISSEHGATIAATLCGGGLAALGQLGDEDVDCIRGDIEREKLHSAVKAARQMGAMADAKASTQLQTRRRLAGVWELSRAALSAAAQELMGIIAYYPGDCTMEEVLVWGSFPSSSSIARAFRAAEAAAAPSSCKCVGCIAQRRRKVVAALAHELEGVSLVKRRFAAAHTLLPGQCFAAGGGDQTTEVPGNGGREEYGWLSVRRVVQVVVRNGIDHATSRVRHVVLAWRAALLRDGDADTAPPSSCRRWVVMPHEARQVMAARHVASTVRHIRLDDAVAAMHTDTSTDDSAQIRLLHRLCTFAWLLCQHGDSDAAKSICEWVGAPTRRGSGLWYACVRGCQGWPGDSATLLHESVAMLRKCASVGRSDIAASLRGLVHVDMACQRPLDEFTFLSMTMLQGVHGGQDSSDVAVLLRGLGQVSSARGRLDESTCWLGQSLVMLRRIHGDKDHSEVVATLNSLAHVYMAQGRLDESASLHEESLAMYRRIHGSKDHSDVAATLNSLAHVHMAQGRLDESVSRHEESLAMYRRIHGSKDHSDVAASLCSLAQVYMAQGRLDESACLNETLLVVLLRIHGSKDHRDVAASLNRLGRVYMAQDRLEESASRHEESLAMYRRIHGSKDHRDVATSLCSLARVYMAQGRLDESASRHEKSVAMYRRIHGGKDHSDVAASLYGLAQVYMAQGRLNESVSRHEESLAVYRGIHGSKDHSDVAACLCSLAQVYMAQGRPGVSLLAHTASLAMYRRIYHDKDDSDLAAALISLGQVYMAQRLSDWCASLHEESLAMYRRIHGSKDHNDVAASLVFLAQVYMAQGRLDLSVSLHEESLAMYRRIHRSRDHRNVAACLCSLAQVYMAQGRLDDSALLHAGSLAMDRRIHGSKDHSDVAASLCSLAQVYMAQGRLDECASLHVDSLAMYRRIHGSKDHGGVAASLNSLAQVYMAQGRLDESVPLFEESLAMYRRVYGSKDHSSVAACLCSLAQVYMVQGRLDDSVSLHEESLAMYRRIHGSNDHCDVAACLCSLAQVHMAQGRLDESASLHEDSLAMHRRIHGSKDHSGVAASMCSLAQVYMAQGRLDESAYLHEESLAMYRRIHGSKDHSDVAACLCSLAQVYMAQGQLGESVPLHEESLAMYRRIHGHKDHSDVAASVSSLAQVYMAQGRLDDSASRHEESLAMYRRIHGSEDHNDVAAALYGLAQVYIAQGLLEESSPLHEESLAMYRRIHGSNGHDGVAAALRMPVSVPLPEARAMYGRVHDSTDHSSVAASLCSLAQVYMAQGRLIDCASLHEESLAMCRRIHGRNDHNDVAVSLKRLAQVYMAQGRLNESSSLYEQSLAMYRRIHGSKDHSSVAASLCGMAQVYMAQGRLEESASLHKESLAMYRRIHGSKDHSDVAASLSSLAQVCIVQLRLDDALSLQENSLAMLLRIHGSNSHSDMAVSLNILGRVYMVQGRLDDSASRHKEALAMYRRIHCNKDHSDVAASLCSLALVYMAQGRLDDSAPLYEDSLAMYRRIHGSKDHSDVAASMCSLARVYMAQGRSDECASLHVDSLAMYRRIHGSKDHSGVAASLCSLAQVYMAQGRLDESVSLHEESLAMYGRIYGSKDHSGVAACLCSLAQVYMAQGRLDDSVSLHEDSLAMYRRIHGSEDHSGVAASLNSLARVYMAQGRLCESVSLHEESLVMYRRIHGSKDHGGVAACLCSLARVYMAQSRLDESASLHEEALAMYRGIHGHKDHSGVAASLSSLAQVYMAQGRLDDSVPLYEESLAMYRRIHGSKDHSDVAATLCSLAQVSMAQGQLDECASLHVESLAMYRGIHGSKDHSDVAASMCSLARVYMAQGRLNESVSLHEESLAMYCRIYGSKDHSGVAACLHSLAQVYMAQGRLDDSAPLHEESLAMHRRIHGSKDHGGVAASLNSLAQVYMAQGRLDESASLHEESLAMYRRIHGSKDHGGVAACLCSLAQVYMAQGRLDESASLHEESLAMCRRFQGSMDHSDVAASLNRLLPVYMEQDRLDDSAPLHEESLAMYRRIHGSKDHRDVVASLDHLPPAYVDESAPLHEESLAMYRRIHGSKDHSDVAACLCSLARVYMAQDRLDESVSRHEESLAMYRRIHGSKDHSDVAACLCSLAQVYMAQSRLDESVSLHVDSLAMYRRIHGSEDHRDVAACLCSLARVYMAQGQLDESASLHEESLAMYRRIHGSKDHSDVAAALYGLAQMYTARGRLDESPSPSLESLAMCRRIHGGKVTSLASASMVEGQLNDSVLCEAPLSVLLRMKNHHNVAVPLYCLVHKRRHRLDISAPLLAEPLAILIRTHATKEYSDVAALMRRLAQVFVNEGRLDAAVILQEDSLVMLRRLHHGMDNSDVAALLRRLAHAYLVQGRLEDSASMLEMSVAMFRRIHGSKDHSDVAVSLRSLGQVYRAQGRLDEAAALSEESLAMLSWVHGSMDHSDVAVSQRSLGEVYVTQGRLDESASLLDESLAMLRRIYGSKDHTDVATSLCSLVQVYLAQGRLVDAASLAEESLAMLRRLHGRQDNINVAASLRGLAQVYMAHGRADDSVSLLEQSLAMMRRVHGIKDHSEVATSLRSLGQVYMLLGRCDESASLQEESLQMYRRIHGGRRDCEVAASLHSLAHVRMAQGHLAMSASYEKESLAMKQHIASSRTTLQRARRLRRYPFPEDWELQRVQCTIVPMTEPQSVDGRRLLPASLPNATVVNGVRVQHRRMWQEYRHAQSNVDSPYRVGWMWLGTHRWSPTEIIRSTDGLANCADKSRHGRGWNLAQHATDVHRRAYYVTPNASGDDAAPREYQLVLCRVLVSLNVRPTLCSPALRERRKGPVLRLTCASQIYPEQIITYTVERSEPCSNQLLAGPDSALSRSSACPNVPSTAIGQWSRENAPSASLRERDGEPGSAGSGIAALADPATGADVATASPSPPPSPPPLSAVCVVSPRREPGEASPPPRDLGRGAVSTGTSVAGPTAAASRSPDKAPSTPTGSGDVVDIHAVTIVASSDDGGESASNRGHSPGEQAASASATSAQAAPSSMPVVGAMGYGEEVVQARGRQNDQVGTAQRRTDHARSAAGTSRRSTVVSTTTNGRLPSFQTSVRAEPAVPWYYVGRDEDVAQARAWLQHAWNLHQSNVPTKCRTTAVAASAGAGAGAGAAASIGARGTSDTSRDDIACPANVVASAIVPDNTKRPNALLAMCGGGGTGKSCAVHVMAEYALQWHEASYLGGCIVLCGESLDALHLDIQRYVAVRRPRLSRLLSLGESCDAFFALLAKEPNKRRLIVVDNCDQPALLLRWLLTQVGSRFRCDILFSTRASPDYVRRLFPQAVCRVRKPLSTWNAALVLWRVVAEHNSLHNKEAGWPGCQRLPRDEAGHAADATEAAAGVAPDVPIELQLIAAEDPVEWKALTDLAADDSMGCGGLPLALRAAAEAICSSGVTFGQFLHHCRDKDEGLCKLTYATSPTDNQRTAAELLADHVGSYDVAARIVSQALGSDTAPASALVKLTSQVIDRLTPTVSLVRRVEIESAVAHIRFEAVVNHLCQFGFTQERALAICSAKYWPPHGELTLATVGRQSKAALVQHICEKVGLSGSETEDLFRVVRHIKMLGAAADPEVVALAKQRSKLESVWTLSHRHISQAAQGVMRLMSFFPPEPQVMEAFVWGNVKCEPALDLALRGVCQDAVCDCKRCAASRRRVVVRRQVQALCDLSLLHNVPGEDAATSKLCMHPAVSSVVRAAATHAGSGPAQALACATTCGPTGRGVDACHDRVPVMSTMKRRAILSVAAIAAAVALVSGSWELALAVGIISVLYFLHRRLQEVPEIASQEPSCGVRPGDDGASVVAARQAMSERLVEMCEAWTHGT